MEINSQTGFSEQPGAESGIAGGRTTKEVGHGKGSGDTYLTIFESVYSLRLSCCCVVDNCVVSKSAHLVKLQLVVFFSRPSDFVMLLGYSSSTLTSGRTCTLHVINM